MADTRWSLILRDYHNIRLLVVGNSLVMQGTGIQVVNGNQNTLIQRHNSRQERQGLSLLLQGTALPPALPESEEPLQEAKVLPAQPTPVQREHQYRLPESTAGRARQRTIMPKGPVKRHVFMTHPQILTPAVQMLVPVVFYASVVGTNPQTSAPPTTAGATPKRPYRRTVEANTCSKCGQFRTADTGHSQYRGRVYCPRSEALSKDQWLEEMRKRLPK